MDAAGPIDLLGTWRGSYSYDRIALPPVEFDLVVTAVNGTTFTGHVTDNNEQGGTPGTGTITGACTAAGIAFTKRMPIATFFTHNGEHYTVPDKKHRPLRYIGTFSTNEQAFSGTWFFDKLWMWKGLLPHRARPGTGTWTMRKV